MPNAEQGEPLRAQSGAEDYDRFYQGDASGEVSYDAYNKPYWESHYFPLYRRTLDEVVRLGGKRVLEVGCGSGSFAHLLFDNSKLEYHGFDFSAAAIAKARVRTGRPGAFSVADASGQLAESWEYDTVVCLEVLEHIEGDLDVIRGWKAGAQCVCSVPNFDQPDHVRYFRNEGEVRARYEGVVHLETVARVPRALVRGRGWREYLRQLRWSRNDPRRFLGMLGFRTFEYVAGWVLFSGRVK